MCNWSIANFTYQKLHKKKHSPAPPTTAVFWHGLAVAACLKLRRFSMARGLAENRGSLPECVQNRKWTNDLFAETLRESSGQLNFSHFRTSWRKRNARKLLGLCGFMVFYVFLLNSLVTRASQARVVSSFEHEMKPKMRQRKQLSDSGFQEVFYSNSTSGRC